MPVYICNSALGAVDEAAKPKIAADITRIHCEVTGAPAVFVHAVFVEEVPLYPRGDKTAFVVGSIRKGRTDDQKGRIQSEIRRSFVEHAGLSADEVGVHTVDTPASWVMEGGDIFPEPGEEAAWLAAHGRKGSLGPKP
ncbi:MAG: DNA-binding protein [Myxococcota bacterium]